MVELKQKILTSLSKLSDRDTHQIAVEDLEKTISGLSPDAIPMILNCLYDAATDPKPAVKRDALRLLAAVCAAHSDAAAAHLTKIIAHVVRRLKDADSAVRDACRDTVGALAAQYLKGDGGGGGGGVGTVVGLFVKPLFEAMGEQNKGVQAGAAVCMAKMVECGSGSGGGEAVRDPLDGGLGVGGGLVKTVKNHWNGVRQESQDSVLQVLHRDLMRVAVGELRKRG